MLGRLLISTLVCAALLAGCASKGAQDPAPDRADDAPRAPASPSASPAALPAPTFLPPAAEPAPGALPSPASAPAVPAPAGPLDITLPILQPAFPPLVALPLGSTVTWTNLDDETHSVLSPDGAFSGTAFLAPGMEFHRTFLVAGEYAFQCRYHEGMSGLLVIG